MNELNHDLDLIIIQLILFLGIKLREGKQFDPNLRLRYTRTSLL